MGHCVTDISTCRYFSHVATINNSLTAITSEPEDASRDKYRDRPQRDIEAASPKADQIMFARVTIILIVLVAVSCVRANTRLSVYFCHYAIFNGEGSYFHPHPLRFTILIGSDH